MPLTPRQYDLAALRRAVGKRRDPDFDWVDDESISREWREVVYERLLAATAMAEREGEAYLESIPRTTRAEKIALDWCVHLVERLGGRGALEMLTYYRELGWIGDDAHSALSEKIVSFSTTDDFTDAPTEEDHTESFSYIVRLVAVRDDLEESK
ncbi:FlaD/FlaE family flagellar protein [Haloferax namakaokahaiae]|uniref:FlaD/FlaE family flagellar protein n=1 Tax=Haloferax namakaokahaiae TaxID=1748331 RepID=A0ABD5ZFH6_9EURY